MKFEIPGKPQPKQRPRRDPNGVFYTPNKTRKYEQLVAFCALLARPPGWPKDRRYSVSITVTCPDKRGRDIDNVAKSILDGMNDIIWDDDAQVDQLEINRIHGPKSQGFLTVVEITPLDPKDEQ